MFVKVTMVTIPMCYFAFVAVYLTTFYWINVLEDRDEMKKARVIRFMRWVAFIAIVCLVMWIDRKDFCYAPKAIIAFSFFITTFTFGVLCWWGWTDVIMALIRDHRPKYGLMTCLIYGLTLFLVTAHLLASLAAIIHWDAFFDKFASQDDLLEYHLALDAWQREDISEWEEMELYG